MSGFISIFLAVFLAELGDKTQLAALMFSADDERSRWVVFLAATSALALSTAIAVLLGSAAEKYLSAFPLKLLAGLGFIIIGAFMITEYIRG